MKRKHTGEENGGKRKRRTNDTTNTLVDNDAEKVCARVFTGNARADDEMRLLWYLSAAGPRWMQVKNRATRCDTTVAAICAIRADDDDDDEYIPCSCDGHAVKDTLLMLRMRIRNGKWSVYQRYLQDTTQDIDYTANEYPIGDDDDDDDDDEKKDTNVPMETTTMSCDGTIHTDMSQKDPTATIKLMQRIVSHEETDFDQQAVSFLFAEFVSRHLFTHSAKDFDALQRRIKRFPSQYGDFAPQDVRSDYKAHIQEWVKGELSLQPSDTFEHNFRQDFYLSCIPVGMFAYACRGNHDEPNAVTLLQDSLGSNYSHKVHAVVEQSLHLGMDPKKETFDVKEVTETVVWMSPSLLFQRDQMLILHTFANYIYDRFDLDFMHQFVILGHQIIAPPDRKRQREEELFDLFEEKDPDKANEKTPMVGNFGLNKMHLLFDPNYEWGTPRPIIVEMPSTYDNFHWYVKSFDPDQEESNFGAVDIEDAIRIWMTILAQQFKCKLRNGRDLSPIYNELLTTK